MFDCVHAGCCVGLGGGYGGGGGGDSGSRYQPYGRY